MEEGGSDTHGKTYESVEKMWEAELQPAAGGGKPAFFEKAIAYWGGVPASVDGVLGVRAFSMSLV